MQHDIQTACLLVIGHMYRQIRLGPACSFAVGAVVLDSGVGHGVVVWRVGAVGTVRFEGTLVHLLYAFNPMAALAIFGAWGRFGAHV
jgi:hypothetical protein